MKIIITGPSGFIGQHLIKSLSGVHELIGISRQTERIEGLNAQYTWDKMSNIPQADWCIHLAGLAHDLSGKFSDQDYVDQNYDLTRKLISSIEGKCEKLIYFSSIKAICDQNCLDLDESSPYKPLSPYGLSKQMAEEYIVSQGKKDSLKSYIFRPVMVYGDGSKGNLNSLVKMVKKGIPYPFKKHQNKKSILYIKNLTHIVDHFISHSPAPGIYHLADEDKVSTVKMVELISTALDKKQKTFSLPGFIYRSAMKSTGRIGQILKKLLSNLSVNNNKLLKVLAKNPMPYSSENAFKDFL